MFDQQHTIARVRLDEAANYAPLRDRSDLCRRLWNMCKLIGKHEPVGGHLAERDAICVLGK